jgi:hypothetical protein
MLANNTDRKSHDGIAEDSIPNFVWQRTLLGVKQTALGHENLIFVVETNVHTSMLVKFIRDWQGEGIHECCGISIVRNTQVSDTFALFEFIEMITELLIATAW